MLRGQSTPPDPMSFLSGSSEMARRIREFDWAGHPFGEPSGWPQSLRSALSICLHSAFPSAIYWGSELRLLYNDAWSTIPGPRHPSALGAPAKEVWADIWHVIEPQFLNLVASGDGVFLEDQLLPMRRFGALEETYWSYSFTAIRGEDGAIEGVFNSGFETTRGVLSRREMAFLLELGEALRKAEDASEARRCAIGMLGEQIQAARIGFREIAPMGEDLPITDEWTAEGVAPLGAGISMDELGAWAREQLEAGRFIRIDDVGNDANLGDAREVFARLGVGAALAAPWLDQGRLVAVMFAHSNEPRVWTDFESGVAEKVLERTWNWVQKERAAERERTMMREIDHRARNALSVVQSVARLTQADDVEAFRRQIGDRITALARTHDLLSSKQWRPVDLASLIKNELSPFSDCSSDKVRLQGPHIMLQPELAQSCALLFHELATNAAKYGAFSGAGGALEVLWSEDADGAIELDWVERLPSAPAPRTPERVGFGSTLLQRVAEDQLGGTFARDFDETGMRCRLVLPLTNKRPAKAGRAVSKNAATTGAARVLIVEDELLVALDLEAMIEGLGLSIFATATSVQDALAQVNGSVPDLAILDANLGGETTQPVAEALIARGVPVIFATGYAQLSNMPDALQELPCLSKPVSSADLAKTISGLGFSLGEGN